MSSGSHNVVANTKSRQFRDEPHRPLENGLKVKLSSVPTKDSKTNPPKASRPKSSAGPPSSSAVPAIAPRLPELSPAPPKTLLNGNHNKPGTTTNASPPKVVAKARTPSPTKLPLYNGGGKNSLLPPSTMGKYIFFPETPVTGLPSTVLSTPFAGFTPDNGKRLQVNGNSEVASKISEIIGTARKILPANPGSHVFGAQRPAVEMVPPKVRKEPVAIRPAGQTDGKKSLPAIAPHRSQSAVVSGGSTYPQLIIQPRAPIPIAPVGAPARLPVSSSVIYPGDGLAAAAPKRPISPSPVRTKQTVSQPPTKAKPPSVSKKRKDDAERGPSKKQTTSTAAPKVITVEPIPVTMPKSLSTISPPPPPVKPPFLLPLLPCPVPSPVTSLPPQPPHPRTPNLFGTITTTSSSNEDFHQFLTNIQSKISQEFGGGGSGGGGSNSNSALSPKLQSPPPGMATPEKTPSASVAPLSPEELRAKLRKLRKANKVVDLAVEEDVATLTTRLDRILLSEKPSVNPSKTTKRAKSPPLKAVTSIAPTEVEVVTLEPADEPMRVLPFKKRQYRGVPSPKTKESSDGAKSGKEGREKNVAANPATTSRSPATSSRGKEAALLPSPPVLSPSTSASPKQPSLKISLKLNQSTGHAYPAVTSPHSSISVTSSSPKSTSTSPAAAAGLGLVPGKLSINLKKRKTDGLVEDSLTSPAPSAKRKNSTSKIKPSDGDYGMKCNSYSEARLRKPYRDMHLMQCECKSPPAEQPDAVGCGSDCGSRAVFIECDPTLCRCGSRCSNQTIQKGLGVQDLELFQTTQKGQGVRCRSAIKKGTFICEYVGEVVSMEKFRERMKHEKYSGAAHHYCLKLDAEKVIDAYRCGGIARFINHSCEPNSQTQKWLVKGQDRMAIFAKDDIPAGEEITYDYKFESFDVQQKCYCGAKSCRGFTGIQKSQKLNGLLMKKRPPSSGPSPSPSSTVSQKSTVLVVAPVMVPVRPRKPNQVNGTESDEFYPDLIREHELMIREKICLPRNIRGATRNGRKMATRRPEVHQLVRARELSRLATAAVKELFPSSQTFPSEYFKPVPWEPSPADVRHYTKKFGEEVIRCTCGIFLEDSTMVECDECKSWQHCECVGHVPDKNVPYKCDRCSPRPLDREIHQNLPASSNPDNLDCFVTLLVPNCQNFYVRVGDCVYLTKDRKPPAAGVLYDPLTVDILRIDKMWRESDGTRWIFGNHYLRPHETYHEAGRSFFENELLKSHHLETIRMEAVLGRCCIMDSNTYSRGRPREYPLHHCFICDLKVNKGSNQFVTLKSKDRVTQNPAQYYFEQYPERLIVRRTFKPHQIPVMKKKAAKTELNRKKTDSFKSEINLVKERCERIHSVLETLLQKRLEKVQNS